MSGPTIAKGVAAVGILAVIGYTFFRGQGWWWKLTMPTRVALAIVFTVGIVAAGFFYKTQ